MSRSKWLVLCATIFLPGFVNAQSMRLQDTPLGSVVQIGSFNYIKVAENKYMQSSAVTCPHGAKVGGQWVKCVDSEEDVDKGGDCEGNCVDGSSFGKQYAQSCLTCATGYKFDSATYNDCILKCGDRSSTNASNTLQCDCDNGYTVDNAWTQTSYQTINTACNYLKCGSYSNQTSGNDLSCTCTEGYTVDSAYTVTSYTNTGGSCPYLICGENSSQTSGNPASCTCDEGKFTNAGLPSYTDYGNSCPNDCPTGRSYSETYTGCKLDCDANATNSDADTCSCNIGYYTSSNTISYTSVGGSCSNKCSSGYVFDTNSSNCVRWVSSTSAAFDYTGTVQIFQAPSAGTYKLEVWGASGGSYATGSYNVGYGGYSVGSTILKKNEVLYITIGGAGKRYEVTSEQIQNTGGYNGGGGCSSGPSTYGCATGGGATHIAKVPGLLSSLTDNKSSILIVAGGGAGAGYLANGGNGGGYAGGTGGNQSSSHRGGFGGTQTSGGSKGSTGTNGTFGQGGDNIQFAGAGAGGGWYGGGGGGHMSGGGGGSGYLNISELVSGTYGMYCYSSGIGACSTNATYYTYAANGINSAGSAAYAKSGNGYAKITKQ